MPDKNATPNRALTLSLLGFAFLKGSYSSIISLARGFTGRPITPIRHNTFLEILAFIFSSAPKRFWLFPSAVRLARAPATLLRYIFERDTSFSRK